MVLVAVVVVVVTRGGEDSSDDPVKRPVATAFPARGELADDQALLDAAAEAWRDTRRGDAAPTGQIEVLYAGEVAGEDLPVYGDDRRTDLQVVVLSSGDLVVTAILLGDDTWDVGTPAIVPRSSRDTQAMIDTGGAGYLLSAETFEGMIPAVELPRPLDEDDEGDELTDDERTPRPFEIDSSTGLWQPTVIISGDFAVRVPAGDNTNFIGQVWIGVGIDRIDALLQTETAGGVTADAALWEQLLSVQDSAAVVAAVERAAEDADVVDDEARYVGWQAKIRLRSLGGSDVQVPEGARRVAAMALGIGSESDVDVVTMGFLDPESGRTDDLLLGERPPELAALAVPLAARWVVYRSQAILFYAGSADLTLDLQVGNETIPTPDAVGAYLPASSGTSDAELSTTLLATSVLGDRYVGFPVGRTIRTS